MEYDEEEETDITFTPKQLVNLIESFLRKRTESKDSGLAKVTIQDMHDLSEIVYKVIEAKWGRDVDGDLPVKYDLTDWTRYRPGYWERVPHQGQDPVGHVKAVIDNLEYASREASRIFDLIYYFNKDLQPMAEYVAKHHPDYKMQHEAEKFLYNWFKVEIEGE